MRSELTATQQARLRVLGREHPGFHIVGWDDHNHGPVLEWPNGGRRSMTPNGRLIGRGGGDIINQGHPRRKP